MIHFHYIYPPVYSFQPNCDKYHGVEATPACRVSCDMSVNSTL